MDIRQQIGQQIRLARERQGLTQQALGQHIGKNATTVSNYENGSRSLPITELPALARALQVSIGYFFAFTSETSRGKELEDIFQELLTHADLITSLQTQQDHYEQQLAQLDERLRQLEGNHPPSVNYDAANLVTFTVAETTLDQILERFGQQMVALLDKDPNSDEST